MHAWPVVIELDLCVREHSGLLHNIRQAETCICIKLCLFANIKQRAEQILPYSPQDRRRQLIDHRVELTFTHTDS